MLARLVGDELTTRKGWSVVVMEQPLRLVDIKRRETTWHMENWYGPLRAWYNDDRARLDFASLADRDFDAVIEVGLLNFEFSGGEFVIQVMIKWFDGASGELQGRSRDYAFPHVASPEELFRNEGEKFKRLFDETGRELVRGMATPPACGGNRHSRRFGRALRGPRRPSKTKNFPVVVRLNLGDPSDKQIKTVG